MTAYSEPITWTTETPLDLTNLNKVTDSIKYLKEVLDGTHATKIPSNAISADVIIAMEVFS